MRGGVAVITVKAGSHVRELLQLLSITGEIPASVLGIIGNERTLKILVHKLESVQEFRMVESGELIRTKLITVSGKRNSRTIRLAKGALSVLTSIDPDAANYYMHSFGNRNFSSDTMHTGRNHRVSEVIAMCTAAKIESRYYALPVLSLSDRTQRVPEAPSFFIARSLKQIGSEELNKTCFTRYIGALFYPGNCYAVYNTRDSVMKWSAAGERKIVAMLSDIARMNTGIHEVDSALIFGVDETTALQTVLESDKSRKQLGRMDRIYKKLHFIPLDLNGIRLLKIITLPDWNEKLLDSLFDTTQKLKSYSSIECDAISDGTLIFSHLDCDLARLIRFHDALFDTTETMEVLCFPWQVDFLSEYLGAHTKLIPIEMEELEGALNLNPKEGDYL